MEAWDAAEVENDAGVALRDLAQSLLGRSA